MSLPVIMFGRIERVALRRSDAAGSSIFHDFAKYHARRVVPGTLARPFDSQFRNTGSQCTRVHFKPRRGPVFPTDLPIGLLENMSYVISLDVGQGLTFRRFVRRADDI